MEPARCGNIPALPDDVLDVRDVALLRGDVMNFCPQRLRQRESHCRFARSRWPDENPCGLVGIGCKFNEHPLRFVQTNEVANGAWTVFLRERYREGECRAHWHTFSFPRM